MLVDELFIPHRAGTVRVPIHERVTVFAGLGETGRHRMARLFVGALAGAGPAYISMRDSSGDRALISTVGTRHADGRVVEGPVPTVEPTAGALERRMIVRAADLGLGPGRPDPFTVADRTAATIAHRQLVGELTAVEAGAAERAHLVAELGPPPTSIPARPPAASALTSPGAPRPWSRRPRRSTGSSAAVKRPRTSWSTPGSPCGPRPRPRRHGSCSTGSVAPPRPPPCSRR